MNSLLIKAGGFMDASLGKQPYPNLLKNPLSHSSKSKRRFNRFADLKFSIFKNAIVNRGGGYCKRTKSGLFVEKVGRRNFSVNFIGIGFIDG
jgi:hypothetical protein